MFKEGDIKHIEQKGITSEQIRTQLQQFRDGIEPLFLEGSATVGDGIVRLGDSAINKYVAAYSEHQVESIKFVPASGAATRMFKLLFQFLEERKTTKNESSFNQFFDNLEQFAFYDDLQEAYESRYNQPISKNERRKIAKVLLEDHGLGYSNLPKGLLKFHKYETEISTPVQEHLNEGHSYAKGSEGIKIHFTVSPEHLGRFENHVANLVSELQSETPINVEFSIQQEHTDTIAVDLDNEPFRTVTGELYFRPAGHGALLENLNALDADVIFIKNIDNVVKQEFRKETNVYKKALAGLMLQYQQEVFDLLRRADKGENIIEEGISLLAQFGWRGEIKPDEVASLLNRPIRVCGMVKNEGEPGGGPFWVRIQNKHSLQIVESSQIRKKSIDQRSIFESGTHFNPVDLICGVRNYKGEKFDLLNFRDKESGFITEKTHQGRKLRALELPGLWNGSMAYWNTVFVEVPLSTFNPVKTVLDLLKEPHN